MKTWLNGIIAASALLALNAQYSNALAQGTAFTYQGQLVSGGAPANGSFDLTFTLFDASDTNGVAIAGPVTNAAVSVSNGLFTTTIDFGGVFDGSLLWLEIAVSTNGANNFVTLSPRQQLTPAPYAITAANVVGLSIQSNNYGAPDVVGGSPVNSVVPGSIGNFIGGGGVADLFGSSYPNNIGGSGFCVIVGGENNTIQSAADFSMIGGGQQNTIQYGADTSFIGGGILNTIEANNSVIGGGENNTIQTNAWWSVIGGGNGNTIQYYAGDSTIGGGAQNTIQTGAVLSAIGGGDGNVVGGVGSVIGGGGYDGVSYSPNINLSAAAVIGGGLDNLIRTGADHSVIGGGSFNTVSGGGYFATIPTDASYSVIGGGYGNTAVGPYAMIPGGEYNVAGTNSFAAGYYAWATHKGSFVWADSTDSGYPFHIVGFSDTADNQFMVRAKGGMQFVSAVDRFNNFTAVVSFGAGGVSITATNPDSALVVNGTVTATAFVGDGSGLTGVFLLAPNGSGAPNGIGGSPVNFVAPGAVGAFIGGGGATNYFGSILSNSVAADFGVIGGGQNNTIQANAPFSVIGGGENNTIQANANDSAIAGGDGNTIQANHSMIGGGNNNAIQTYASDSIIGGGGNNTIQPNASYSTIGGGLDNVASGAGSFIGGGGYDGNLLLPNINAGAAAVIGGGLANTIQTNTSYATIGGGYGNVAGGIGSFIGGGGFDGNSTFPNNNAGAASVIGGGLANTIQTNAYHSMIGGGYNDTIQTLASYSMIGGGLQNAILTLASYSTIGGGYQNTIQSLDSYSMIGGGYQNTIQAIYSTIGGGYKNVIQENGYDSMIGGGEINTISGSFGTVPGGDFNAATNNALAAGHRAKANHTGSFVWADSANFDFPDSTANQFLVRATGGAQFVSAVNGSGIPTAGVSLASGGTAWATISDQNAKKNFAPVNGQDVLARLAAVPVEKWNYKWESDSATPNIGPMAQAFKAAFYPGRDDKSITTLEFDGVELAAIQGLNEKVETEAKQKDVEIEQLKQSVAELKEMVAKLAANQKSLEAK